MSCDPVPTVFMASGQESQPSFVLRVFLFRSSIDVEATDLLTRGDVHEFSNFLVKHQAKKYRKAERKLAASGSMASGGGGGPIPAAVGEGGGEEGGGIGTGAGAGTDARGVSASGARRKPGVPTARGRGGDGGGRRS